MRRLGRSLYPFLLLVLLGCGDNFSRTQPQQRAAVPAIQNLERDYSALVAQFNADSAKVRLVLMLSPT